MKRRSLIVLLAVLFLLPLVPVTARADIIYEPRDTFYNLHREDCDYHARSYTANGPNGDVTVYKSPESRTEVKTLSNGTEVYISYIYEDDREILWGYCDFWEEDKSGWLPMEYMELIYDFISFQEDYGSEFLDEQGTLDEAFSGQQIVFCSYPGSDRYSVVEGADNLPDYQQVYVDDQGSRWGYVGYYFGHRNAWINLDDPTAIPEEKPREETQPEHQNTAAVEEIKPGRPVLMGVLLTLGVAAVVAVTAVTLVRMKKKG